MPRASRAAARLLEVIQHDVKRLDRLISDISDASRLDAELQRQEWAPVDLAKLLNTVVAVANEVKRDDGVKVTLEVRGRRRALRSRRRATIRGSARSSTI